MKNLYPAILCMLVLCMPITQAQGRTPNVDFPDHSTIQLISNSDGHPNDTATLNTFNDRSYADSAIEIGATIDSFRINSTEKDFRDSAETTTGTLHLKEKI